jgi:hypothetical protein
MYPENAGTIFVDSHKPIASSGEKAESRQTVVVEKNDTCRSGATTTAGEFLQWRLVKTTARMWNTTFLLRSESDKTASKHQYPTTAKLVKTTMGKWRSTRGGRGTSHDVYFLKYF